MSSLQTTAPSQKPYQQQLSANTQPPNINQLDPTQTLQRTEQLIQQQLSSSSTNRIASFSSSSKFQQPENKQHASSRQQRTAVMTVNSQKSIQRVVMVREEEEDDDEEEENNTTTADDTNFGSRRNNNIGKNELSKINIEEYKDHGNKAFITNDISLKQPNLDSHKEPQSEKYANKQISNPILALALPLPLVATGHSMAPDMVDGWKPQADKEIPPIPFCFGLVHYNLEQFNYPKVLYVGPRFKNSYKMHEQYANKLMKLPIQGSDGENISVYAYPFQFPKFYDSNNFTYEEAFETFVSSLENDSSILDQDLNFQLPNPDSNKRREPHYQQNSTLLTAIQMKDEREDFIFDSNFESGNLDFVGKVGDNEYDLLMRLDSNSRSHQQWFYFSIDCKDVRRRSTKGETIKINILNFTKPNTLYNQGMRPVAWSKQKCATEGIGWHRVGQNIQYRHSKLCRQNNAYGYNRIWYQMSLEYTFEYDQDKIWFAYAIPYSFTMLCNFIKAIEDIQKKPENVKNSNIFKKEILGKSLSGVEIPILTITDFSETNKRKKTILMVGRLHPGETHSSWLIHGFIRFILSESPKARELRKRIVFKIVPMLNPDGVIIGNYRCTLCGFDMNRNFGGDTAAAAIRLNPETNLFKNMAKQQSRLAFFFDVHSHSSKKSVFIYGPYFPLHSEHYLKIRVLPRLLSEKTSMFRYYSCRFRNEASKMHCSRLTIFRDCNLPQVYTIETSIMGFLTKDRQNVSFGIPSLQYFGEKLAETLLDWFQILEIHQRERIKKAIIMSKQRKSRKRTLIDIIGEEDYLEFRDVIDTQLQKQEEEIQQAAAAAAATQDQENNGAGSRSSNKKGGSGQQQQHNKRSKGARRRSNAGKVPGGGGNGTSTSPSKKKGREGAKGEAGNTNEIIGGGGEIVIMDQNQTAREGGEQQKSTVDRMHGGLAIGIPSTLSQIESNIAKQLESVQVNLKDFKHGMKIASQGIGSNKKQSRGGTIGILSSEEVDEEEEDDEEFVTSGKNQGSETLEPKLTQYQNTQENNSDETNKGFFVPKLAGFEYLEGSDQQKKISTQLNKRPMSGYKFSNTRNANADLLLSNQASSHNVIDDDEQFIYEDQANGQEGDQPLKRLEDIVGSIKKDFVKANTTSGSAQAVNNGGGADHDQFMDERDIDSEKSDDEDRNKKDHYDEEYDEQMKKMQQCLFNYFENVEEIQNRGKKQGNNKKIPPQQPIQVIVKEKPYPKPVEPVPQPAIQKVSPMKIQRPLQNFIKQSEVLIPQKKEIVFQVKKPAITNFPPEKPQTAYTGTRPPTYYPLGQSFMHYNRALVSSQSPKQSIVTTTTETKDLSFTLMNKTNQEFFQLLNKYVDNKGQNPAMTAQQQNYQRANSAMSQNRQHNVPQQSKFNQPQGTQNSQAQNQQLLYQLQMKQSNNPRPYSTNQNSTLSVGNNYDQTVSTLTTDHPRYPHVSSSRNTQVLQGAKKLTSAALVHQQPNEASLNYGSIIQSNYHQHFIRQTTTNNTSSLSGGTNQMTMMMVDPNMQQMLMGVHIDSTATKSSIRKRTGLSNNQLQQQSSAGGNKTKQNANQFQIMTIKAESESPVKRKLVDQAKSSFLQLKSQSTAKKTGRAGGFMLMVDGRGVVNQTEIKGHQQQNKPTHSQTATSLRAMLQSQNLQERGSLQPGQVYDPQGSQQLRLKKSKTKVFGQHSRSFLGGPQDNQEINSSLNTSDQNVVLRFGRQGNILNQSSIDDQLPFHSRHSSLSNKKNANEIVARTSMANMNNQQSPIKPIAPLFYSSITEDSPFKRSITTPYKNGQQKQMNVSFPDFELPCTTNVNIIEASPTNLYIEAMRPYSSQVTQSINDRPPVAAGRFSEPSQAYTVLNSQNNTSQRDTNDQFDIEHRDGSKRKQKQSMRLNDSREQNVLNNSSQTGLQILEDMGEIEVESFNPVSVKASSSLQNRMQGGSQGMSQRQILGNQSQLQSQIQQYQSKSNSMQKLNRKGQINNSYIHLQHQASNLTHRSGSNNVTQGAFQAAEPGSSPMKNQILIDMFRQANSQNIQSSRVQANQQQVEKSNNTGVRE